MLTRNVPADHDEAAHDWYRKNTKVEQTGELL